GEIVLEAGAPATGDRDPEHQPVARLGGDQRGQPPRRALGDVELRFGCRGRHVVHRRSSSACLRQAPTISRRSAGRRQVPVAKPRSLSAPGGFTYCPAMIDPIEGQPYACRAAESRGRLFVEPPSPTRSAFQRDRDRIIHSTAFRRLKYKTQVFVFHEGDHYRTRLTHSIEVAQIARSIGRALALNEDLAEAVALA